MIKNTMLEATRLTRQGRVGEATNLLRRWLSGGRPTYPGRGPGGRAGVIDLEPPKDGETVWSPAKDGPAPEPAAPKARPEPAASDDRRTSYGIIARGLKRLRRPPPEPAPSGARFETRSFSNAAGSRRYKFYVPSTYAGELSPLVVMLHGCTQSPDDIAAGTGMNRLAEEFGFLVAYPEQPKSANQSLCWNWFNVGDQLRDSGEPSILAGITRRVMQDFAVDPARVYVAGMSAGGAAAASLGALYPDLYAAIGVHSGLAYGSASDLPSAFATMKAGTQSNRVFDRPVRAIVFHGDRDTTVAPVNGEQVAAQSAPASAETRVTRGEAKGGLSYTLVTRIGPEGRPLGEHWTVHGAGHAWSGGSRAGTFTDPRGPDASREMIRFFLAS